MKLVSDTGPLIGLAKIDCLSILKDIASEVFIPSVVHRELLGKVGIESERIDKALDDFIRVTDLKPLDIVTQEVMADLDEGERQAIGLASTFSEDVLLLLDDRAGRLVAEKLKIPTTGLIGILLRAKEKGILESIGSLIDELRNQGYWISDEVADLNAIFEGKWGGYMVKKAFLVGINDYPGSGSDLKGCVNDITNMRDILLKYFGFTVKEVRVLTDRRATKANILKRLEWLIDGAKAGDLLVFHYSGHGSQIRDRDGDELVGS